MKGRLDLRSPLLAVGAAVLLAAAIGFGAALASSPASFSAHAPRDPGAARPVAVVPSATPAPPPPPSPGKLGDSAALTTGKGWILGTGGGGAYESDDAGATWQPVTLPAGASGLVIDPASAAHRLAGGPNLLESHDGGKTWQAPRTAPPGPGPFRPLAINPTDSAVWFVSAHGALLRTRDAAVSWRTMTGLPRVSGEVLTPLASGDRFALSIGGRVFDLLDNGNQITERKPLPAGINASQLQWLGNTPTMLARGSDGKIYIDSGGGWSALDSTGYVAALPTGHAWVAAGGAQLGSPGAISVTVDGGASWSYAAGVPDNQTVEAVAPLAADGSAVLAYGYGGDLFASSDAGQTWSLLNAGLRSG